MLVMGLWRAVKGGLRRPSIADKGVRRASPGAPLIHSTHDKDEANRYCTKTKFRLTYSGHTTPQIEKSFLRLAVNLNLSFIDTTQTNSFTKKFWE
ncbi:hypothetical protein M9Y10_040694 [Tritrichomonas musculus]|uniref:Uncharacterized protein n=1 Tax=Tritrichomonas musculus TaxID=1915356 RepID=A0ABR2K2F0_9EUKA